MAEYQDREHFIPIHRSELVELLASDRGLTADQALSAEDRDRFRAFCGLLTAHFHHAYQQQLERLKADYRPFDPDADIRSLRPLSEAEQPAHLDRLFAEFVALLEKANYKRLTVEQMQLIARETSFWGLNMDVDFTAFERLEVFYRGEGLGTKQKARWWDLLGLFPGVSVRVPVYQRLVGILKMRPSKRLGPDVNTRDVFLKMFKEIPKGDVETLLPGARVRMTRLDKGLIGYPLATGIGVMIYNISSSVLAAGLAGLASLTTWTIALALGGYGYKSYYSFSVKKQAYSLRLTQSLYYQALASNAGVLYKLLDEAEEQDAREAILAYYYLWRYAGPDGWAADALDDYTELDLERRTGLKVDFEIGDALEKLVSYQLVERAGDRYRAVPIEEALRRLDERWDNFFTYANTARV
jgi:hypothetical protein